eukprot:scaffold11110_cov101-Isochrysis_galbana.AAC.3
MAAMMNPKVMAAMAEVQQNPAAAAKFQSDPELMQVFEMLQDAMTPCECHCSGNWCECHIGVNATAVEIGVNAAAVQIGACEYQRRLRRPCEHRRGDTLDQGMSKKPI